MGMPDRDGHRKPDRYLAFRSPVAKVMAGVVRDDDDSEVSYLLHCERSSGHYRCGAFLDAGEEFGVEVEGFAVRKVGGMTRSL